MYNRFFFSKKKDVLFEKESLEIPFFLKIACQVYKNIVKY